MRVIVVEDEPALRETLLEQLRLHGFEVEGAGSALDFYRKMADAPADIAIIDLGLPDENGLDIVKWLRSKGGTGIAVITGLGQVHDRIRGFKYGADLYFVKPVDSDELAEALRSLGRRLASDKSLDRAAPPSNHEEWILDEARWELQPPGAEPVKLTATELKFMQVLVAHPGITASRQELCAELGYDPDEANDRSLDALVKRLRRKIESLTQDLAPIQTVHGRGYLFSAGLSLGRVQLLSRIHPANCP